MQNDWTSGSLIQHVPRMTSAKVCGLELEVESVNVDVMIGGAPLSRPRRRTESAWQEKMKWTASSESAPHNLQVGSPAGRPVFLDLKRAVSFSNPSQPTRRRILKLFSRVRAGSPTVVLQCLAGLRGRNSHALAW